VTAGKVSTRTSQQLCDIRVLVLAGKRGTPSAEALPNRSGTRYVLGARTRKCLQLLMGFHCLGIFR
jgi:hypothetical protein